VEVVLLTAVWEKQGGSETQQNIHIRSQRECLSQTIGKMKMKLSFLDQSFDPYGTIDALLSNMYRLKDHTEMLH
jgi:hypothetical protein